MVRLHQRAVAPAALADAYAQSQALNRLHGKSYYLATRLLPAPKRPHVHALYGFTRWADEIVDAASGESVEERERRLKEWAESFRSGFSGEAVTDPLLPAVLHTVATYQLDLDDFDKFLRSMAMDLTVTAYPSYRDLLEYMEGSAAVIGTMMLPILGVRPGADRAVARESARQLGFAFQLTNFLRDVAEDLARGRVYLPEEDLDRFGVTRQALHADAVRRQASVPVRALIEYGCQRALAHYAAARPGLAMLEPRSQICIRAAYLLYGGILDQIGRMGFDVMRQRARVPRRRRAAIVAAATSPRLFDAMAARWHVG
ncbi:MAG TPA: phytoene/squalene synthase family protein [Micromonosporaceae bacterium]